MNPSGQEVLWLPISTTSSSVENLANAADGTEDLTLYDLYMGRHVAEDGRLDKVALASVLLTINLDFSALLLAALHVTDDAVILQLTDPWSLGSLLMEWVTNLVGLGPLLERLCEPIVNAILDIDTQIDTAYLALVDVNTDPAGGLLHVGIVEDDVGRPATHF